MKVFYFDKVFSTGPLSRDSRDCRKPQSVKNQGESDHSPEHSGEYSI